MLSSKGTTQRRGRNATTCWVAFVVVVLGGQGCHSRDKQAMAVVQREIALLKPPVGLVLTDQRVGLGEMYAEGSQTYCVSDEKAAQAALDSMLRDAGWKPLSSSTTAEATVWGYHKDQHFGSLSLETQPQPCGRRFVVGVAEPL